MVAGQVRHEGKMMTAYTLDKLLILDRLGGDEEIFAMMLDMYLQDVDNNCTSFGTMPWRKATCANPAA